MNSLAKYMEPMKTIGQPMLPPALQQMMSLGQQPAVQQGLAAIGNQVSKQIPGDFSFLQSKEGRDNNYNTTNAAGSSAYGKYQFMPSTAKMYAEKIGIDPNQWQTPQNQEAIMRAADADYSRVLTQNGLPVNDASKYAIHQNGNTGGIRILKDKPSASDIKNMNNNLPSDLRSDNPQTIVANWKNKYLY